MAVIKDVARYAGVSVGTVSKYLNRPDQLRPATRERVARAIEELNYRPNPLARSMRTGRTNLAAVFVPDISNPFYAESCGEILRQARTLGLTAIIVTTEGNPHINSDEQLLAFVNQVDGIILYLLDNNLSQRLTLLFQRTKPTVVVTQRYEPLTFNSVILLERKGMYRAAFHLHDIGRQSIAFIGGPEGDCMTIYKRNGLLDALSELGLPPAACAYSAGFSHTDGYNAARGLLDLHPEVDAIACATDSLAVGCMKYLQHRGLDIPGDVAVLGFDDIPLSAMISPALSTVALPTAEAAQHALELLCDRMADNDFHSRSKHYLETELVIRESTVAGSPENPDWK